MTLYTSLRAPTSTPASPFKELRTLERIPEGVTVPNALVFCANYDDWVDWRAQMSPEVAKQPVALFQAKDESAFQKLLQDSKKDWQAIIFPYIDHRTIRLIKKTRARFRKLTFVGVTNSLPNAPVMINAGCDFTCNTAQLPALLGKKLS